MHTHLHIFQQSHANRHKSYNVAVVVVVVVIVILIVFFLLLLVVIVVIIGAIKIVPHR